MRICLQNHQTSLAFGDIRLSPFCLHLRELHAVSCALLPIIAGAEQRRWHHLFPSRVLCLWFLGYLHLLCRELETLETPFSSCHFKDSLFTLFLPLLASVVLFCFVCLDVLAFGELKKSASLYFIITNLHLPSRVTRNKSTYLLHLTALQISEESNHIFPSPPFSQVNHSRFFHLFLIWHGFQILPDIFPPHRPSGLPTLNKL